MIALDTNLLIYSHRADCSEHKRCIAKIRKAASQGLATTTVCILEFITVVTAETYGKRHPSSMLDCRRFLADMRQQLDLRVLSASGDFEMRLLDLAIGLDVHGRKIHDLAIGLMALDGGARELWTHDENFVVPPRLQRRLPLGS